MRGKRAGEASPAWLQRFAVDGKPPQCFRRISVETVFFQCARALLRSGLWSAAAARPAGVPTAGEILQALTDGGIDGKRYDVELPARQRTTLY